MGFKKPGGTNRPTVPAPNDRSDKNICPKCRRGFSTPAALASHKCGRFDNKDDYGNNK